MSFYPRNIPLELKELRQWVTYFKIEGQPGEHPRKCMISPVTGKHARSNVPEDWTDFYQAQLFADMGWKKDGLAFVLTQGIVFVDVDESIDDNGVLSPRVKSLLDALPGTYAERSCSGHGIHILLKGNLPKDCMKRNDDIGLEMYDTKRFCCLTGDLIDGRGKLLNLNAEAAQVARKFLGRTIRSPTPKPHYVSPSMDEGKIIEKAMHSKSGAKFSRLYSGDYSGYPSQSSADLALVSMIAFYTQDPEKIDRIFRSSGLYRDKWDSQRGDTTYGRMTIEKSLSNSRRVYDVME